MSALALTGALPTPVPSHHAPAARLRTEIPVVANALPGRLFGAWSLAVILGLLAVNFVVYSQTLFHPFITFDDAVYVGDNPSVRQGVSLQGLRWAFTTFEAANWHPLTWLSLQLDSQLFGVNAGGYHLTNLLLHQACTVLVFLWLRVATATFWRPVLVAALFALHPLHVESVAWVAERKDVLSAFFFLLTLLAYTRWAQRGGTGRYLLTLGLYTTGHLAKPMLVTLPAVLLLLDGWPLERLFDQGGFQWRTLGRRVVEKLPFFALTVASCVVTFIAQHAGGAVVPLQRWTLAQRVSNAVLGYGDYLRLTFWPQHLSIFYPERTDLSWTWVILVATILVAISAGTLAARRRAPYALVGWLWFLGMLVPVIGLVQVGGQSIADRYTYLPHLGLFVAGVWGGAVLIQQCGRPVRFGVVGAVILALAGFGWRAWDQASAWRDSFTLYQRSLESVGPVARLYQMLGDAALDEHRLFQANRHYRQALAMSPRDAQCLLELGTVRLLQGDWQESADLLRSVLPYKANEPVAFNNFGLALRRLGGHDDAAIHAFERSLKLRANNEAALLNLAELYQGRGAWREAASHYERVLVLHPDDPDVLLRLAWMRATCGDVTVRDGARALAFTQRATELMGGNVRISLDCYAAAYAELGRWPEAQTAALEAVKAAEAAEGSDSTLTQERRHWLALFHQDQSLRL